jgi:uncharacterized membrane-anchored protein YhcB (DUF1043 family)
MREENERFREQVNDHFVETAELINQLTDSYKKVFDHLSDGAERLVDEKVIRERMPQVSDQEIRLKRIGQIAPRAEPAARKERAAGSPGPAATSEPKAGEKQTSAPKAPAKSAPADSGSDRPEAPVNAVGERKTPSEPPSQSASEGKDVAATSSKPPEADKAAKAGQSPSPGAAKNASTDTAKKESGEDGGGSPGRSSKDRTPSDAASSEAKSGSS